MYDNIDLIQAASSSPFITVDGVLTMSNYRIIFDTNVKINPETMDRAWA